VWALMNYGFRVVISSRFADIFRGNSGKQGLLTAQADQGDVELLWKLLENEPGTEITVDLESRTITAKDVVARFQVDDYTRWRLLEGLDDISLTLRHESDITAFEGRRRAFLPTTVGLPLRRLPISRNGFRPTRRSVERWSRGIGSPAGPGNDSPGVCELVATHGIVCSHVLDACALEA
jgi:hypothetical protein